MADDFNLPAVRNKRIKLKYKRYDHHWCYVCGNGPATKIERYEERLLAISDEDEKFEWPDLAKDRTKWFTVGVGPCPVCWYKAQGLSTVEISKRMNARRETGKWRETAWAEKLSANVAAQKRLGKEKYRELAMAKMKSFLRGRS